MRSLLSLVTLIALVTGGVARAETWHKPPALPAGYDGWLILYVLPPARALAWATPADLFASAIGSSISAQVNVKLGFAATGHPIGHVHLEMACAKDGKATDIPLTGQTSDEESWTVGGDGLGILFRDYDGRLDHMNGNAGQGGKANTVKDLDARKKNAGYLGIMRFPVTWAECTHLRGYFDSYVKQRAYKHFGSQFRARGFTGNTGKHEGSGCAGYAVSFVDVAGLVPRPFMTQAWARRLLIGLHWIANFLAVNGPQSYPYGSNTVATVAGMFHAWPVGTAIPAGLFPVLPLVATPWFSQNELQNSKVVPLTLYDPELMYSDLVAQWKLAKKNENPDWSADVDGKASVIERRRPACPPKANLKPYPDEVHDLMKD
jgi:hypothetical protein